jgi:hypothetical protein
VLKAQRVGRCGPELELKISLCPFLPWSLVEHGTDCSLAPKSVLIQLLFGVRELPAISSATICYEHKAVLLVVIGYRNKGAVSKTRLEESGPRGSSLPQGSLQKRSSLHGARQGLNW